MIVRVGAPLLLASSAIVNWPGLIASHAATPTRHASIVANENPLRKSLKKSLLGALDAADDLLGLSEFKQGEEEQRVLDLIAEAEAMRVAAKAAKARRTLAAPRTAADEESMRGTAADLETQTDEEFEWSDMVPQAQVAAQAKAEEEAARQQRKTESAARQEEVRS